MPKICRPMFEPGHDKTALICHIDDIKKQAFEWVGFIRIYHECEGRIESSVPRIAVWHDEACRVKSKGRIFLSYPHTNNGFFFLLTTVFIYLFILK